MTIVQQLPLPTKTPATVLTIADVKTLVGTCPKLDNEERHSLVSALNTLCQKLNIEPENLVANLRYLRRKIDGVAPAAVGLSPAQWEDVSSRMLAALELAGVRALPGRYREPLPAMWEGPRSQLPEDATKAQLTPLLSFFANSNIAPSEVTAATFDRFDAELKTNRAVKRPAAMSHDARIAWNKAAKTVSGWPKLQVKVPNRRRDFAHPKDSFPDPFQQEAGHYQTAKANPDIFAEDYRRPLSALTLKQRQQDFYLIATALVESGFPKDKVTSLAVLAEPANAEAALRFLHKRNGEKTSPSLARLAGQLANIGKNHVGLTGGRLERLRGMAHNLRPETSGFTEKNRAFLRQFADPRALPKLLGLSRDLVDRAENNVDHGRRDAELVAYAVAIGIELVVPLRMEDLAGLRWDEHIHIHGDIVLLSVKAHKNGCVVNAEATPALVRLLDLYRSTYWSTLASPGSPWVFPGKDGGRRQTGGFGSQLSLVIYRETGIMMTPHQFRHLAAWIYLRANPGDHETLRRLLGHASVAAVLRFYQELEKLTASQRFNEIITGLVEKRLGQ